MIMRQQRGNPDEGYFFNSNTLMNFLNGDQEQLMQDYLYSKTGDYEADLFTFNFSSYSGKFMYDQISHKFINTINQNFIYEFIPGNKIQLTDNQGNKFIFTAFGKTETRFTLDEKFAFDVEDRPVGPITWKLTKIITNQNKEIIFNYSQQMVEQYTQPTLSKKSRVLFGGGNCMQNYSSLGQIDEVYTYSLTKIETDDTNVNFIWSEQERLDSEVKSLNKIEIRNKNNDLVKSFNFSYNFVQTSDNPDRQKDRYRMYLDQIDIQYPNNQIELYRQFFYSNRNRLPSRLSTKKDHWGFHNNKYNSGYIPKSFINYLGQFIYFDGGDRNVDPNYAQDGILNRIILPTKGEIQYTYESNKISTDSLDVASKNILFPIASYAQQFFKDPSYIRSSQYKYQFPFVISNDLLELKSVISLSGCQGDLLSELGCDYQFYIFNDTGTTIPSNATPVYQILNKNTNLSFPSGNYILGVKPINDDNVGYFDVNFEFLEQQKPDEIYVGGVRVNKIEFYDNSEKKIEKRYKYNYFNNNISSGHIQNVPSYAKVYNDNVKCSSGGLTGVTIAQVKSIPVLPLYDESGSSIMYTNVTEEVINLDDNSKNIKTEYIFSYEPDVNQSLYNSKNTLPLLSYAYKRGNITKKTEYKNTSGIYNKSIETINSYDYIDRTFAAFYISQYDDSNFYYEGYASGLGYALMNTSQKTEYRDGVEVVTTTQNTYDSNTKNLLTETAFSLNESTIKNYKYSVDKGYSLLNASNMTGIPLEVLTLRNSSPVSRVETIYPTLLPDAQTGNLLLPKKIESSKANTLNISSPVSETKETDVVFDRYDDKGNILQYTIKGITPVTIIWGYHKTHPIAKIEGAFYDDVKNNSLIANIISLSNNDNIRPGNMTAEETETALRAALLNLRKNASFQGYQITTFTYDLPLGLKSITPPSGVSENYFYDATSRLQSVKDANGNILKEYKYNYRQP